MLAMTIIGIGMVALMKGFIQSLDTIKRVKVNEQAMVFAQSLMDDIILEPPADGDYEGCFGDDIRYGEHYKNWYWEIEVEAEEPDYEERPSGRLNQDLEHMYITHIRILREEQDEESRRRSDKVVYVELYTILMEPDIFSLDCIQQNQLF